jgi:Asp-tRNA(Asn)/Glu-tRNA(Gln) amidotransferase C subunit
MSLFKKKPAVNPQVQPIGQPKPKSIKLKQKHLELLQEKQKEIIQLINVISPLNFDRLEVEKKLRKQFSVLREKQDAQQQFMQELIKQYKVPMSSKNNFNLDTGEIEYNEIPKR